MRHALLAAVLAVTAAGCGKGDHAVCEKACRNYATLSFWAKWDPKIKAEPANQQAKLRRDKLEELDTVIQNGVDMCITQCVEANNTEQYECMANAHEATELKACSE